MLNTRIQRGEQWTAVRSLNPRHSTRRSTATHRSAESYGMDGSYAYLPSNLTG